MPRTPAFTARCCTTRSGATSRPFARGGSTWRPDTRSDGSTTRPGSTGQSGSIWLSNLFYPDLYQEDLRTNAREFYQLYYGVQPTDRQLEALIRPAEAKPGETSRVANVPLFGAEPPPMPGTLSGASPTPPAGAPGRNYRPRGGQPPALSPNPP